MKHESCIEMQNLDKVNAHPPRKAPTGFRAGNGAASQRGRLAEKDRATTRPRRGRNSFDRTVMVTQDLRLSESGLIIKAWAASYGGAECSVASGVEGSDVEI